MAKRKLVVIVAIIACFSADSTVRADRLFQGRIINRLFGGERNSPSKKKDSQPKKKKAKKDEKRNEEADVTARSSTRQSFRSHGFGFIVRTNQNRLNVVRVIENGMAKQAGIRAGDQIVKVAGAKVENVEILREIEKVLEPGNEVELVLRRAGKRQTVTIAFEKATAQNLNGRDAPISPPAGPAPPFEPTPAIAPADENSQAQQEKSILRFPEELIP